MPALGQDTRNVITELGLAAGEIDALAADGVIRLPATESPATIGPCVSGYPE